MPRPKRTSTQTTKIFADRLEELIQDQKERGITREEVCKKAEISTGIMSEWLSDSKTANIDNFSKIAKCLDASPAWLLGLSDDKSPKPSSVDELGISKEAVNMILGFRDCREYLEIFSRIVSSVEFWSVVSELNEIKKENHSIERDSTIENEIFIRKSASDAENALSRRINAPARVLVSEDFLKYSQYRIQKNLEEIVIKSIAQSGK